MKKAKVISGFPGVGKTGMMVRTHLSVLDSDSSSFSWLNDGVRSPDFPSNYIFHIKDYLDKADYILVSSHDVVRRALQVHQIDYSLVYPDAGLKEEYLKRYRERGNNEKFVSFIDAGWDQFISDIETETFPTLVKLQSGEFLSDVLDKIK